MNDNVIKTSNNQDLNDLFKVVFAKLDTLNGVAIDLSVRVNQVMNFLQSKGIIEDEQKYIKEFLEPAFKEFKENIERLKADQMEKMKNDSKIITPNSKIIKP